MRLAVSGMMATAICIALFDLHHLLTLLLWAAPTTTRSNPQDLLRDFLDFARIPINRLRVDTEFVNNDALKALCKQRGITVAPTAEYTHTMAARVEGAVRICKEHVRCMLKEAKGYPGLQK